MVVSSRLGSAVPTIVQASNTKVMIPIAAIQALNRLATTTRHPGENEWEVLAGNGVKSVRGGFAEFTLGTLTRQRVIISLGRLIASFPQAQMAACGAGSDQIAGDFGRSIQVGDRASARKEKDGKDEPPGRHDP
jgi:hypothetical protein